MRKFLKRVIEILDGTPAVYGKPERGQSVLEMTLITPLLIILIVGIVEIGWYAHNYLTLLEVSRVGARRGAILTGDNSPLKWDENASLHYRHPQIDPRFPDFDAGEMFGDPGRWTQDQWDGDGVREGINRRRFDVRQCPPAPNTYVGFYNLVLCQMAASLTPLEIKWTDEPDDQTDDIIISVFAIQMVNNAPLAAGGDLDLSGAHYRDNVRTIQIDEYEPGWIPVVVGRFPTTTNECNMWRRIDGASDLLFRNDSFERDPFDYWQNNDSPDVITVPHPLGGTAGVYSIEMAYEFRNSQTGEVTWVSMGYDEDPEMQRGFNYTGYRRVEQVETFVDGAGNEFQAEVYCYGSDWTVYDVQELLKGRRFRLSQSELDQIRQNPGLADFGRDDDGTNIDTGRYLASQGLILVEIYWRHQLLLDLPVFSPVFQALGSDRTTIYVWSAFPVPAVTPDIRYNLTWEAFE